MGLRINYYEMGMKHHKLHVRYFYEQAASIRIRSWESSRGRHVGALFIYSFRCRHNFWKGFLLSTHIFDSRI